MKKNSLHYKLVAVAELCVWGNTKYFPVEDIVKTRWEYIKIMSSALFFLFLALFGIIVFAFLFPYTTISIVTFYILYLFGKCIWHLQFIRNFFAKEIKYEE